MTIINRIKYQGHVARRGFCERFGIDRYSRPARYDMDRKLQRYLPRRGVFVEAGAHDGFSESNTYYLEKIKGWSGVLVEPMPHNARACARLRSRSRVFNCALVAADYGKPTISMMWGDRMSWVRGVADEQHRSDTVRKWTTPEPVEVPARTISSVLDEAGVQRIDFFSLDVEGFEPQVLAGLDFSRHSPAWMLVECLSPELLGQVTRLLSATHELRDQPSYHDYLFQARSRARL